MDQPFWQTAIYLTRLGIRVFPVAWQSKAPFWPRVNWKDIATNNEANLPQVLPNARAGLAVVLGPSSGILDIELDSEEAQRVWDEIHRVHPEPRTVAYQSRRGTHRWFRWSPELAQLGKTIPKYAGIEVRLGSEEKSVYSVVPPSLHEKGEVWYQWLPGCAPWESGIAPLPPHLFEFFKHVVTERKSAVEVEHVDDDFVPQEGHRHDFLLKLTRMLAGDMRLPRSVVVEMVKPLSDYVGKTADLGEEKAEKELVDMVNTVQRSVLPEAQFHTLDFGQLYEDARGILQVTKAHTAEREQASELPSSVFPRYAEQMSRWAQAAQLPRHLFLQNMLSGVAASIGAGAQIRCALDAPPVGLQQYMLGVSESGVGKSQTMKLLLEPFSAMPWFATDATSEALRTTLAMNKRGAMLKVVEGKQLNAMMGRYTAAAGGSGSNNSILLEAWSGDTIAVVRQDIRKSLRIENPCLNIAAAIQPHNLNSFSVEDIMEGLMQRMVIYSGGTVPEDVDPVCRKALSNAVPWFFEGLRRLQTIRPYVYRDDMSSLAAGLMTGTHPSQLTSNQQSLVLTTHPIQLSLDQEGATKFITYQKWKRSMELQNEWPEGHPFRTDMFRHAEIALRVTGLLFFMDYMVDQRMFDSLNLDKLTTLFVPSSYLDRAILWMEWCWSEKKRLMESVVEDRFVKAMPENLRASGTSLTDIIRKHAERRSRQLNQKLKGQTTWTLRDYYRNLRMRAEEANNEVSMLLAHGFVKQTGTHYGSPQYEWNQDALKPDQRR